MSLIITKNFKRAKAQDAAAADANFKKGDKVTVKTKWAGTRKGIVKEVINDPALKKAYVVEIEGAETGAYPAEIVSADVKDSIATDVKFKKGDRVRRGKQTGIVRDIEKEPYIEVKFTDEPVTVFVHESELVAADSRAADACGTDAKFQKGDKVRVWQYPVYGKMGEVVEATNGSMEYTVNVEGKDYPRIDYRRIVKVSNAAGDAAARDKTPDGWWEGKTIFAAFGWGKSVKGKVVSHKGGVIKLEDGTQFKESDAYDLYAISSSARDSAAQDAKFKVGDRVKHAKVKFPVQPIGKISEVYDDPRWVEVEWENTPYKYQTIETSNLLPANSRTAGDAAELNNDANDSAAKFRIGQEVMVKTKYTEPYKARIVGLWDMSQNGPYDEQGYLIKNIKGGGVESMPEHALSLATAKDSAAIVFHG